MTCRRPTSTGWRSTAIRELRIGLHVDASRTGGFLPRCGRRSGSGPRVRAAGDHRRTARAFPHARDAGRAGPVLARSRLRRHRAAAGEEKRKFCPSSAPGRKATTRFSQDIYSEQSMRCAGDGTGDRRFELRPVADRRSAFPAELPSHQRSGNAGSNALPSPCPPQRVRTAGLVGQLRLHVGRPANRPADRRPAVRRPRRATDVAGREDAANSATGRRTLDPCGFRPSYRRLPGAAGAKREGE